ncbi:MAG: ribosome-associated translation inhibitor RaiA [Actinobacteria bacterium]|nr:ribosome-associated translation inhibitor RaiA [Actinomycetota bacterium]
MELTCTGRGVRVTDVMRRSAERKLARLDRLEQRVTRLDVEVIVEKNPRLAHMKRLEAALVTPRKTYRAHAEDPGFENALDLLVERLERQVRDHHEKRRAKVLSGARSVTNRNELESTNPEGSSADTSG